MKKRWNEFWKDYKAICKESKKFYKKHWFGIAVMLVVIEVVTYGIGYFLGEALAKKNQIDYDFDLLKCMNEPVNDIHEEGEEE